MKFILKIWKTGNAHVVTIPFALIKSGVLQAGEEIEVDIKIKEVGDDGKDNT